MIPWQGLDKVLTKYDPTFRTGATCPTYTRRSRQRFCQVTWGEVVPSLNEDLYIWLVKLLIASCNASSVGFNLNLRSGVLVTWTTRQQWPQQSNWTSITSRQSLSSWIQSLIPFIASHSVIVHFLRELQRLSRPWDKLYFININNHYKNPPPQSTIWSQLSFGIIFLVVYCCEFIFAKVPRLS